VQVPTATKVTVDPDIVQIVEVCELKLTGKPEVAVAATANGAAPNATFESVPKLIVWGAFVTLKLSLTGVAAEYEVFPTWVAWIVQVPTATNVTVDPDIVQIVEVCELKLTGRPEVAVALTANGAEPNALSDNAPKLIVCPACVTLKL
jgi:NADPH-dependent 7-cyano-7-deazaguanine reductase QueF-like protein